MWVISVLVQEFFLHAGLERRGAGEFHRQEGGNIEDNLPIPLGDGRSLIILLLLLFQDQETPI